MTIQEWLTDKGFLATGGMYYKLIEPTKMVSTAFGKPFGKQRMTFMLQVDGVIQELEMYDGDDAGAIPWLDERLKRLR
jgi:hypothetical protein